MKNEEKVQYDMKELLFITLTVTHSWHHIPAGELGGNFADDAGGCAPACWCEVAYFVAHVGRGRRAVVGGAAALV